MPISSDICTLVTRLLSHSFNHSIFIAEFLYLNVLVSVYKQARLCSKDKCSDNMAHAKCIRMTESCYQFLLSIISFLSTGPT